MIDFSIRKVTISNFRSFVETSGEPHVFDLGGKGVGLHFIGGRNLAEPKLGANGAGKSSLFDAIYWAFYGKTLQGITGDAVVYWGVKSCRVVVNISLNGVRHTISRAREGRNLELKIDGKEATQDSINRLIGLTDLLFEQALVRRQFATMFLDKPAAAQTKLLTEVLNLEVWADLSDKAKAATADMRTKLDGKTAEINMLNGRRDEMVRQRAQLDIDAKDAEVEHSERKKRLVAAHNITEADLAQAQGVVDDAESRLDLKRKAVAAFAWRNPEDDSEVKFLRNTLSTMQVDTNPDLVAHRAELAGLRGDPMSNADYAARSTEAQQLNAEIARISQSKAEWQARIAHFDKLRQGEGSGVKCPTCEQLVRAEHAESCINVANENITRIDAEIADLNAKLTDVMRIIDGIKHGIDERVKGVEAKIAECERILARTRDDTEVELKAKSDDIARANTEGERLRDEVAAIQQEIIPLAAKVSEHATELKNRKAAIDEAKVWVNPHSKRLNEMIGEANDLNAKIKAGDELINALTIDLAVGEYWIDGFKKVRLFAIDRAISTLEAEVNSSLGSLGLTGFEIHFATERVGKTGNVSAKFDVLVRHASTGETPVPLTAWSGGEYQRLRLACELGIGNLILSARGIRPDFEIYDEPTTHLSAEGVESLMDSLTDRARLLGRKIIVIDHVARAYPFLTKTIVEKDMGQSRIVDEV